MNKLPLGWKKYKAQKIINITRGASPRPKGDPELFDGNIPWVKIGDVDVKNKRFTGSTSDTVTDKGAKKSKLVDSGTLVVSNSGTCGYPVFIGKKSCVHDGWLILKNYEEMLNPHYLYEFITFRQNYLKSLAPGSTQINLNTKRLGVLEINTPSLPEQRKIASLLYNVDQAIQKTEEIIEQTQRVKKGLMQDLFTEGYFEHDEYKKIRIGPIKKKIPVSWELVPIQKAIINRDSERVPVKSTKREEMQGDIPYYGASGIIDYVDDFLFNEKLILLAEDGANLVSRTKPISFIIDGKTWVNNHAHVLEPKEDMDIDYIMHFFRTINYKPFVTRTAQPKLNQKMLNMIEIPQPSLKEQKKIGEALRNFENKLSQLKDEKHQLQRIKKGLMQDLLTGKVRTKDKDIEVLEEVLEVDN